MAHSARYLIRFDDFCPTMLSDRRERFLSVLSRYNVSPILAVVPDNQDSDLKLQPADPDFWNRMRECEAAGATIAMHGYRHVCDSHGRSLIPLHKKTEFAGVDESNQRDWLHRGLEILRSHGLSPRLFVAPRHGFDHGTLRALSHESLGILSDGFASRTYLRQDILCIPQQLWEPVPQSAGLWTICIHTNTATKLVEDRLDTFLRAYAGMFSTFEEVASGEAPRALGLAERIAEFVACQRVKIRMAINS